LFGAFETYDLRLLDLRFQLRGERPASDRIALVEVDDATIEAYGRWPLRRDQYGLLIEALANGGARAIGLDLLFLGADIHGDPADTLLAAITARHPHVVHAITFVPAAPGSDAEVPAGDDVDSLLARRSLAEADIPVLRAAEVVAPEAQLLRASGALGHVLLAVDRGGVARRIPPLVRYAGHLYPSLALSLASLEQTGRATPRVEAAPGGFVLPGFPRRSDFVPLDRDGASLLDFAGDRESFTRAVSMLDVVRWYAAGDQERLQEHFRDRVVLVGATAVAQVATDVGATPFSASTPLLMFHANALDAFLGGGFITRLPRQANAGLLLALAALLGWLFVTLSLPWAAGVAVLTSTLIAALDYGLFVLQRLDVPPTAALVLPPFAYACVASYRYIFLERRARERQKELQVARDIQRRLLPTDPPRVPGLEVFGTNLPAQEVGGDYYDWIPFGDCTVAIALGDVSGKGVAAALLMSHLRASLHAEVREDRGPASVAQSVHASLVRAIQPGRFATFFLAQVSCSTNQLRFCNAGHNPALLWHEERVRELAATGLPLGMIEEATYEEEVLPFEPGDVLVVYSDGISECPWKNQQYGDERLRERVETLGTQGLAAEEIARGILSDVEHFAHGGGFADDVTLLIVRRI
jgi:CHASE2 domain-containing sensor protein